MSRGFANLLSIYLPSNGRAGVPIVESNYRRKLEKPGAQGCRRCSPALWHFAERVLLKVARQIAQVRNITDALYDGVAWRAAADATVWPELDFCNRSSRQGKLVLPQAV